MGRRARRREFNSGGSLRPVAGVLAGRSRRNPVCRDQVNMLVARLVVVQGGLHKLPNARVHAVPGILSDLDGGRAGGGQATGPVGYFAGQSGNRLCGQRDFHNARFLVEDRRCSHHFGAASDSQRAVAGPLFNGVRIRLGPGAHVFAGGFRSVAEPCDCVDALWGLVSVSVNQRFPLHLQ